MNIFGREENRVYLKTMRAAVMAVTALAGFLPQYAAAADTFDIDVVLPLTGGAAFLGKSEQQALTLYEKVVKDGGGIN